MPLTETSGSPLQAEIAHREAPFKGLDAAIP